MKGECLVRLRSKVHVQPNGKMVYLRRAATHKGERLESLVTKTSDKHVVLTVMKKVLNTAARPKRAPLKSCAPTVLR
jgi:transposase-like protein